MKHILSLLLAVGLTTCDMNESISVPEDTVESKYRVGEIYTFKARSLEPNARLIVVKVEHQLKNGNIIHVYVDSVKVQTSSNPAKYSTVITHMPFDEAALDSSGLKRIGETEELPDYRDGYDEWRTSYCRGKAGVFSISVGKAVEYMEETMLTGYNVDK